MNGDIHELYCVPRAVPGGPALSLYEIWEEGGAFNDSVTPSTYCAEYRSHMVLKIVSLSAPRGRVFSIGCGNGFVEADLAEKGRCVHAIDCNAEAVTVDYSALPGGHLASFDVVYADGLLGHLYRADTGLDGFFHKLEALRPRPGSWLVFSNDSPLEPGEEVSPHPHVKDFWLLSKSYLAKALARAGFRNWESYYFPYFRPLSGLRNRTICIARAASV